MPRSNQPNTMHELPVLRVRLRSPDGTRHQFTTSSTWRNSLGFSEGYYTGTSDEAIDFRLRLTSAISEVCQIVGGEFLSLDVLLSETEEISMFGTKAPQGLRLVL